MNIQELKEEYKEFAEVTRQFYAGEIPVAKYKGFSGGFGSYAQRGGKASMLRLRLQGGRINKDKLNFIADSIEKYQIDKLHFTTCQTVQLHNLDEKAIYELMVEALDHGIITRGGGGDFPRNVMVSPLSGVEQGEYFDVTPYADAAADYLMGLIKTVKLPRKLKVGFSNSPANVTHATYRDLGFVAKENGCFDVYSAGGLGNNPKMGVLVAEDVAPCRILYYIKAMVDMFTTYGNYENRAKARSRYMQEVLGDNYVKEFQKKVELALKDDSLKEIEPKETVITKTGEEEAITDSRIIAQKQKGLYAVVYHPAGGCPAPKQMLALREAVQDMEQVELRLSPDEKVYIINCTAKEAQKIIDLTPDSASNLFESSVACIGSSICQVGLRDSQKLLHTLLDAAKEWNYADGVLPQIHISGCPSSCGTHQTGRIGFRGASRRVDGKPVSAFLLCVNGREEQGCARFGEEIGTILEEDIPSFLKDLGKAVSDAGTDFETWYENNEDTFKKIAQPYL